MKKNKLKSKKRQYDTFSITMELEKPLLENENIDEESSESSNNKTKKRRFKTKKIIKVVLGLAVCVAIGFFIWLSNSYIPTSEAKTYLKSSSQVEVSTEKNLTIFEPVNYTPNTGVILYPGAKVEVKAYAKICSMIAQNGYKVVAVDMPLNYSKFGINEARKIIDKNTEIDKWVMMGDSLGGSVAADYISSNPQKIEGIVFISAYPNNRYLKEVNMKVLSMWGSKDGVLKYQALIDAKEKLPENTTYVEIEGANHSQFADYGNYKGDDEALISSDKQKSKAVESILQFLNEI